MAFSVADLVTPARVLTAGTVGSPEHADAGAFIRNVTRTEETSGRTVERVASDSSRLQSGLNRNPFVVVYFDSDLQMRVKLRTPFVSVEPGEWLIAVGAPRGQGFTVHGGDQLPALIDRALPASDQTTRTAAFARIAELGGAVEILADGDKGELRVFTRDGPVAVVQAGSVTVGSGIGRGEALNLVGTGPGGYFATVPGELVDPLVRSLDEGDAAGRARARDLEAALASTSGALGKREFAVADELLGTYVLLAEVAGARGDANAFSAVAEKVGQLLPRVQADLGARETVAVAVKGGGGAAARLDVQDYVRSAQRIAVKARVIDQVAESFAASARVPSNREAVVRLEAALNDVEHAVADASAQDAASGAVAHGVRPAEPVLVSTEV